MVTISGHSNSQIDYEEYRSAVIKYMKNYLREIKEELPPIEPILGRVFEKSKFYGSEDHKGPNINPALRLKYLQNNSKMLLKGILRQTDKFEKARHRIEVEKAIFVIGAGFSFESGAPMESDLDDILRFVGVSNYTELRRDLTKCLQFKENFKKLVDKHEPGISHRLIASNFPSKVTEIICLNWDNFIERAFTVLGRSPCKINKESNVEERNHLWKFHGDVEEFDATNLAGKLGWVFPDEGGFVFTCFKDYLGSSGLSSELFSIFIVGYAERDEQVKMMINELERVHPRPTYRTGMEIVESKDDFYLLGPSAFVLNKILG